MATGCWMQVPWWLWPRTGQQWPPSGSALLKSWWNPSKDWTLSGREQLGPGSSGMPTGCCWPADSRCLLYRDIGKRLEVRKAVTACLGEPNHITRLEHVQARLTLSYNRRGDLAIHLISPMGTRSTLLAARCSPCSLFISWFIPSFVPQDSGNHQ
jgi:hypothetical protein